MVSDLEIYLFDLRGYVVLPNGVNSRRGCGAQRMP